VKGDPGWTYEGTAFYIQNPSAGQCPAETTPIYRSYNNGAARNDSNHRYTVDYTVFANSASFGYQPEGLAMCAPLSVRSEQRPNRRNSKFRPITERSFIALKPTHLFGQLAQIHH
jgi:hypothetical protein